VELRWLRAFVAVVDNGGFRSAAEHLHIAQPAVSRQVQALERSLGVALFLREPSGTRPTTAGSALHQEIQPLIAALDAALAQAKQGAAHPATVRVGYVPPAMRGPVPALVARLHSLQPATQVELHEMTGRAIADGLRSLTVDVGMLTADHVAPGEPGVVAHPIAELRYMVAVAESHPLAGRRTIDLHDLDGTLFISFATGEPTHDAILALVRQHCPSSPVQHAFGFSEAYGLLAAGAGFCAVPPLPSDPPVPHVRLLATRPVLPTATLVVATRRRWRAPAAAAVEEFARSWPP